MAGWRSALAILWARLSTTVPTVPACVAIAHAALTGVALTDANLTTLTLTDANLTTITLEDECA